MTSEAPGYRAPPIVEALVEQEGELVDAYDADAEAKALGWSVRTVAKIPVALEGLGDMDWHLEPHELGF